MKFYFNNESECVEALEYLLRINVGFSYNKESNSIDLRPADHDQLPIYDDSVVVRLNSIKQDEDSDTDFVTKGLSQYNVAG